MDFYSVNWKRTTAALIAALLTGCGTDGPSDNDPKPLTASATLNEGSPYTNLDLSRDIKGCAIEASVYRIEIGPEAAAVDGLVLPFSHQGETGPVYALTEGVITKWLQALPDGSVRVGLSCLREEEFR